MKAMSHSETRVASKEVFVKLSNEVSRVIRVGTFHADPD
jgi:hypothetical protein